MKRWWEDEGAKQDFLWRVVLFLINFGRHTAGVRERYGGEQDWGAWCEISKESIKNYA